MKDGWDLVFMGTPEFAVPGLRALARSGDRIPLVITRPDREQGRGRKIAPPPVKEEAARLGLPIWQPESIRKPEVVARIRDLAPDLLVVVAFGRFLPIELLTAARIGALNLHPSLLPDYRGPAPINFAILNGETETGVTTMFLDEGMDTGPTLLSRKTPIGEEETAGELHDRLAELGAELLVETVAALKAGTVAPTAQPPECTTICRSLEKEDGRIDWAKSAEALARQVRGLDPWPGAFAEFRGKTVKLFGGRPGPGRGEPGQVLSLDGDRLHIAAGEGSLAVKELQLAGKNRQPAPEFWNGQRLGRQDRFA
jgi:methionyl-tRNA formyltransferase